MKRIVTFLFSLLIATSAVSFVHADTVDEQRDRVNRNVATVLGGSIKGTYSKLVWDMSTLFDDGYELRVLPVLGKGSVKAIEDLLFLRGIDAALVQSDVLDFMTELDIYPNLSQQIRYISVFYNEEVHLVARAGINSIQDLDGKRVNFGPGSSGTFITSSIVFDRLGLNVDALSESYQDGLELLKKGEIDALVRVAGAPVKLLEEVSWEHGLKIIEIPPVEGAYFQAELNAEQYPGLIAQGENIQTISVASVLAAYNWPQDHLRREPVDKLYAKLKDQYTEFRKDPYHPKWREVEFDRELPVWSRWEPTEPTQ